MNISTAPLEIHYLFNQNMSSLVEKYFLATLPSSLIPVAHFAETEHTGEFDPNMYYNAITKKSLTIVDIIENGPQGVPFIFSDVDIIFFKDFSQDILSRLQEYEILFQQEWPKDSHEINSGFQLILRCQKTADFYREIAHKQLTTSQRRQQPWANKILSEPGAPHWNMLPRSYSSRTNRGLNKNSWLFHANVSGHKSNAVQTKELILHHVNHTWILGTLFFLEDVHLETKRYLARCLRYLRKYL